MTESTARRWYIAHCKPQCELKAKVHAQENGWEIFLPWYKEPAANPARAPRWRALLPGYIFATGGHDFYALKNPFYVNRLLEMDGKPYECSETNDPFMKKLLSMAKPNGLVEEGPQPLFTYLRGETIDIGRGSPFEGRSGTIVTWNKTVVDIWLPIFGGYALTKVPHEQVRRRGAA